MENKWNPILQWADSASVTEFCWAKAIPVTNQITQEKSKSCGCTAGVLRTILVSKFKASVFPLEAVHGNTLIYGIKLMCEEMQNKLRSFLF